MRSTSVTEQMTLWRQWLQQADATLDNEHWLPSADECAAKERPLRAKQILRLR